MRIAMCSNIGKRRTTNQDYADYFTNEHNQTLMVLCDGVGGHLGGDVASQRTTLYIGEAFKQLEAALDLEQAGTWLLETIQRVNQQIYQDSLAEENLHGMGTTLVIALVVEQEVLIAHVGDSRAYIYQDNQLIQFTEDHSLVNELIRAGEITLEESYVHPLRNAVAQSIGLSHQVNIELKTVQTKDIDMLLLCSDGLTNMVSQTDLTELFTQYRQEGDFAERLVASANEAGGMDNISVIVASNFEVEKVEEVSEWK